MSLKHNKFNSCSHIYIYMYIYESESNPIKFRQLLVQTTRINYNTKGISTGRSLLESLKVNKFYRLLEWI